jgi:rod shape-determining protein MreD
MRNLVAFPILAIALILQMAVVSRLTLLAGAADLLLVIIAAWSLQEDVESAWLWALLAGILVGAVSGLPLAVPIAGYLAVAGLARLLLRRVWEAPILAMLVVVFFGTLFYAVLSLVVTSLSGGSYPAADAFSLIILPSILLNSLLALPVYAIVRDIAGWVYPAKELL